MVGVTELVESYSTIAQHEWDPVWTLVVPYLGVTPTTDCPVWDRFYSSIDSKNLDLYNE